MGWISAGILIAKIVGVAAGTVAAIGLVTYGIYQIDKYLSDKKHCHTNERKKNDEEKSSSRVDYEEIKKTQDTQVRHRNVKKEEDIQNERNENKSATKKEQCHKEVQTSSEQGTQTGTCGPQDFTLPTYENRTLSDDVESVSSSSTFYGTLSTCDSLASTETVLSDIDQELLAAQIPTWNEMSDVDRALCLCPSCEVRVSTITIPCEHPYLCDDCAPVMQKFYSKCPHCHRHIRGYQSI